MDGIGQPALSDGALAAPSFFPALAELLARLGALDALIFEELEQRQQSEPGEDILSLMMAARYDDGAAMSRQELRDQLLTLLLAGHETSAVSIAWALYELDRNPDVLQKLLNEIESLPLDCAPDDLIALPYLEAVVKETLRLHVVTPNVPKQLNVPMQIGRYLLPAGAGVTIAFGAVHQRPELYPEPTLFRPERFLERKFGPFEYLPFGGGNRRCIGAAFAMYEIRIVLAELASALSLSLLGKRAGADGPTRRHARTGERRANGARAQTNRVSGDGRRHH